MTDTASTAVRSGKPKQQRRSVKAKKLKTMPYYPAICTMVEKGMTDRTIIPFIRARGGLDDMSDTALSKSIYRLKQELTETQRKASLGSTYAVPQQAKESKELEGDLGEFKDKLIREQLNEINKIEHVIKLQMERIDIDVKLERSAGKLFDTTHKEIKELRELLHAYHLMKANLGITDKVGTKSTLDININAEVDVRAKLAKLNLDKLLDDRGSTHKVLQALKTVLKDKKVNENKRIYREPRRISEVKIIDVTPKDGE